MTPEMTSHGVTALRRLDLRYRVPVEITSHGVTALRRIALRRTTAVWGLGIRWRRPQAGGPCGGDAPLRGDPDRRDRSVACRSRSAPGWGPGEQTLSRLR